MGHAETQKQHEIHVITRAHRHINALQARLVQPRFFTDLIAGSLSSSTSVHACACTHVN
jgi:hypothetical protein